MKSNNKPNLSQRAFWDAKFDEFDYDLMPKFIIKRVCHYGKNNDFEEIVRYYEKEKVIGILTDRIAEINNLPWINLFADSERSILKAKLRILQEGLPKHSPDFTGYLDIRCQKYGKMFHQPITRVELNPFGIAQVR